MLQFSRPAALEYLVTFILFWGSGILATVTSSNRLQCDPSGCPITPVHPVLLLAASGLALGMVIQGCRQAHQERHRILPPDAAPSPWTVPALTTITRCSLVTSVMLFGLALPSALRAARHRLDR